MTDSQLDEDLPLAEIDLRSATKRLKTSSSDGDVAGVGDSAGRLAGLGRAARTVAGIEGIDSQASSFADNTHTNYGEDGDIVEERLDACVEDAPFDGEGESMQQESEGGETEVEEEPDAGGNGSADDGSGEGNATGNDKTQNIGSDEDETESENR